MKVSFFSLERIHKSQRIFFLLCILRSFSFLKILKDLSSSKLNSSHTSIQSQLNNRNRNKTQGFQLGSAQTYGVLCDFHGKQGSHSLDWCPQSFKIEPQLIFPMSIPSVPSMRFLQSSFIFALSTVPRFPCWNLHLLLGTMPHDQDMCLAL